MTRLFTTLFLGLILCIAPACGGDDDGGGDGDGDGSAADAAGDDALTADEFCSTYETVCEYGGDHYLDETDCLDTYGAYDDGRQSCTSEHVGLAALEADGSAGRDLHCGHATGADPCN
jgi:hypothetical protein